MDNLVKKAIEARKLAYAPYSNFKVGAAIETADGKIYQGCNIENVSLGLTVCAERVALWKAVSEGHVNLKKIVLVADTEKPCSPCGACRQVLLEFGNDLEVIMSNMKGETDKVLLKELLPESFILTKKN